MGFIVKRYPNLIAGYNTMSEERKKKVDVEGLSSWIRNCLIAMALLILVSPFALKSIGWTPYLDYSIIIAMLLVMPFLLIGAQRYDRVD